MTEPIIVPPVPNYPDAPEPVHYIIRRDNGVSEKWTKHPNGNVWGTSGTVAYDISDYMDIYTYGLETFDDDGNLVFLPPTERKAELGRRLFGEVQNNHRIAKIVRQLVAVHLRHTTHTGHLVDEDNDLWLDIERESQRSDITYTLWHCLSDFVASIWLRDKLDYLDFFHSVADLYHRAVFRGDENAEITWAEFSAMEFGGGRNFRAPSDLMSFYAAVIAQCQATKIKINMTPADFVRDVVFAVPAAVAKADGQPNYPSIAPTLELELTTDANTPTLCIADATGYNIQGDVSYQWQTEVNGEWQDIAGETSAEFDYADHSGNLQLVARAADYIGGEITATASVIKIA